MAWDLTWRDQSEDECSDCVGLYWKIPYFWCISLISRAAPVSGGLDLGLGFVGAV